MSSLLSIHDSVNEPAIGGAVVKHAVDRAVAEREIPLISVPRGLDGRDGLERLDETPGVFPSCLSRPSCPSYLSRPSCRSCPVFPPMPRRSPGARAAYDRAAGEAAAIGRHSDR